MCSRWRTEKDWDPTTAYSTQRQRHYSSSSSIRHLCITRTRLDYHKQIRITESSATRQITEWVSEWVSDLSSILIWACSSCSMTSCNWDSSSNLAPQPSTRDRSLPVPRGRTPTWHCDHKTSRVICTSSYHTAVHHQQQLVLVCYMLSGSYEHTACLLPCCTTVAAKLVYCSGFCSAADTNWLDAFLKWCKHYGYCPDNSPNSLYLHFSRVLVTNRFLNIVLEYHNSPLVFWLHPYRWWWKRETMKSAIFAHFRPLWP